MGASGRGQQIGAGGTDRLDGFFDQAVGPGRLPAAAPLGDAVDRGVAEQGLAAIDLHHIELAGRWALPRAGAGGVGRPLGLVSLIRLVGLIARARLLASRRLEAAQNGQVALAVAAQAAGVPPLPCLVKSE